VSKIKRIVLVFLCVLILLGCIYSFVISKQSVLNYSDDVSHLDNGVLDISDYQINSSKSICLDGKWGFYWNKLLVYPQIIRRIPDSIVQVPKSWGNYSLNGESLSNTGYATYTLHVKTNLAKGTVLALELKTFSSAYNLYINNELIASAGKVARNKQDEVAEYNPQIVAFSIPDKDFYIIIQTSNFHYSKGGFWNSIYLGRNDLIVSNLNIQIFEESFAFGTLFVAILLYLIMYVLQKAKKSFLYLVLLCLSLVLTMDLSDQLFLLNLFPDLGFDLIIRIWYISGISAIMFGALYFYSTFKTKLSRISAKITFVFYSIMILIYSLTSPLFFAQLNSGVFVFVTILVLSMCANIIYCIKSKREYGWLFLAFAIVLFGFYVHDSLLAWNMINDSYGPYMYIASIVFIFVQIYIQAKNTSGYIEKVYSSEIGFLQAQIKPHFLYNTINTIISVSRTDVEKSRKLLTNLSRFLRGNFEFKAHSHLYPLKNEISITLAYLEIAKARFEERLNIELDITDERELMVPNLILQPIVENALIHGILPKLEGGTVSISIKKQDKSLVFSVKDNGVGMEKVKTKKALAEKNESSIALSNIEQRLRMLYKTGLTIKSVVNEGTEVTWVIPIY